MLPVKNFKYWKVLLLFIIIFQFSILSKNNKPINNNSLDVLDLLNKLGNHKIIPQEYYVKNFNGLENKMQYIYTLYPSLTFETLYQEINKIREKILLDLVDKLDKIIKIVAIKNPKSHMTPFGIKYFNNQINEYDFIYQINQRLLITSENYWIFFSIDKSVHKNIYNLIMGIIFLDHGFMTLENFVNSRKRFLVFEITSTNLKHIIINGFNKMFPLNLKTNPYFNDENNQNFFLEIIAIFYNLSQYDFKFL